MVDRQLRGSHRRVCARSVAEERPAASGRLPRQAVPTFGDELLAWVARFGLADQLVNIDKTLTSRDPGYSHHGVRPALYGADPAPALKTALPATQLATVVVMALHNGRMTLEVIKSARLRALNPPVAGALIVVRDSMGADAYCHLLRLVAAYAGW